jgi:hypothetical protein
MNEDVTAYLIGSGVIAGLIVATVLVAKREKRTTRAAARLTAAEYSAGCSNPQYAGGRSHPRYDDLGHSDPGGVDGDGE